MTLAQCGSGLDLIKDVARRVCLRRDGPFLHRPAWSEAGPRQTNKLAAMARVKAGTRRILGTSSLAFFSICVADCEP
jgi:hypothetical protein